MSRSEPFLPPRWIIRLAWKIHRALYRYSGGRLGLRETTDGREGLAKLTTTGRRSGQPREVMIAFLEDQGSYVTLAMNGWDAADPAWWLNLQENPHAQLVVPLGQLSVVGTEADGAERERLWERWREIDHNVDKYAERRTEGTPVVVLTPE